MPENAVITGLTNAGLAGMLFYMWYMQSRKETDLSSVIKEQVEDKKEMRVWRQLDFPPTTIKLPGMAFGSDC